MSLFASRSLSDPLPIPGTDPPATCVVRTLTGREVDAAQEAHLRATIGGRWAAHGWAAIFQRQLAKGTATAADAEQLLTDQLAGYDRHTLVMAGLVSWTLADPVLSPEAIEDLGDDALEWFARAVLRQTKPGLFQTPAARETERKND